MDFFWINRDQRSFEWFVNLLSQLEIEQAEQGGAMDRFLDMHMYITSALQKTDMKAVGLQLALDLLHKKVNKNVNKVNKHSILLSISVQERLDHRTQDQDQCWTTKLGQGLQRVATAEEGQNHRVFLWIASTWQDLEAQMRRVWIRLQEGELLKNAYKKQENVAFSREKKITLKYPLL